MFFRVPASVIFSRKALLRDGSRTWDRTRWAWHARPRTTALEFVGCGCQVDVQGQARPISLALACGSPIAGSPPIQPNLQRKSFKITLPPIPDREPPPPNAATFGPLKLAGSRWGCRSSARANQPRFFLLRPPRRKAPGVGPTPCRRRFDEFPTPHGPAPAQKQKISIVLRPQNRGLPEVG